MEGNLLLNLFDSKHQSLGASQSIFASLQVDKLICFSDSSKTRALFSFDLSCVGYPTSKAFSLTVETSNITGEFICPTNSIKNNWIESINEAKTAPPANMQVVSPNLRESLSNRDVLKTPRSTPHFMRPLHNQLKSKPTAESYISSIAI